MNIQIPANIQQVFTRFEKTGSLGEGAEKNGPEMDVMLFTSFRDKMEDAQAVLKMDQRPGMDKDEAVGGISCTKAALQELQKPFLTTLDVAVEGPMADPDRITMHKSNGQKESYEYFTAVNGAPAILTANLENGQVSIGSNLMLMENGQPKVKDGLPEFAGEFLCLK